MKKEADVLDHVVAATGVARAQARKVVEATFAFVRDSALAGAGVSHPSLGTIKVRTREVEGAPAKTIYRFDPNPKAGGKGGGPRKGKGRRARAGEAGEA